MRDLTDTDRQIFVGVHSVCIDHHVVRAVHRTQNEGLSLHFHCREHVLLIMIPVTGSLVQTNRADTRCHNVQITELSLFCLDIILKLLPYGIALRKEHRQSASYQIVGHKQLHLLADLSVIALLCLLQKLQMCLQLLGCRETYTVNTLHHVVVRIALPVHAGIFYQLEILAELCIVHVRSAAEICKIALVVDGDRSVLQITDQIQLVLVVLKKL